MPDLGFLLLLLNLALLAIGVSAAVRFFDWLAR